MTRARDLAAFVSNADGDIKFDTDTLFIDSSANKVGIRTNIPPHALSVFGTGAGNATVQIEGEGGADPTINFLANNTQHWAMGIDDSDSDTFKISEHSALGTNDYLNIDVNGNVGIGITSPPHNLTTTVNAANSDFLGSAGSYALGVQNADTTAGNAASIAFGHGGFNFTTFISSVRTGTGDNPKGDLVFGGRPSDGGTFTERARLTPDGLTFNGDTAAANALDDYEEGTFTLTWTGTAGTNGPASTDFKYVKIGNSIIFNGNTGATVPTAAGELSLNGLPFAANGHVAGCAILYRNLTAPSGAHTLTAFINSTNTRIEPFWSAQGTYVKLNSSHINSNGSQDMYFAGCYRTL